MNKIHSFALSPRGGPLFRSLNLAYHFLESSCEGFHLVKRADAYPTPVLVVEFPAADADAFFHHLRHKGLTLHAKRE